MGDVDDVPGGRVVGSHDGDGEVLGSQPVAELGLFVGEVDGRGGCNC